MIPEKINTSADFEQLFLHVITHFYEEIDLYGKTYGPDSKTKLLSSIKSIITEYIPAGYQQYLADYPDSLTCIYGLVKETINAANKLAGTPS